MDLSTANRQIESQERFQMRVAQEWRRSERSGRPTLLILFDRLEKARAWHDDLIKLLDSTFRETDVLGWFKADATFGVICLELGKYRVEEARDYILTKLVSGVLDAARHFSSEIVVTVHVLPPYSNDFVDNGDNPESAEALWKNFSNEDWRTRTTKRILDVAGSLFLLTALLPILVVIAGGVMLTSPGPVLFRQTRAGLRGRTFGLFKFRTMEVNKDDCLHQEYVKQFIKGTAVKHLDGNGEAVYKLTHDPRVTRFGRFLRRTSLDELPQLWNVLRGDMTLVGPRPPLPYEVECYDLWHRRRVFALKPGLTGLWQVRGRSRCSFDEMIRLDLQHGKPNSLLLYFQVLLETPRAVVNGGGAH
jgi:lipopolysaccharide/colanic/teichoic acid biosynthesis glycosyltransferase